MNEIMDWFISLHKLHVVSFGVMSPFPFHWQILLLHVVNSLIKEV